MRPSKLLLFESSLQNSQPGPQNNSGIHAQLIFDVLQ